MELSFKKWCELNGYLHTGHRTYESFEYTARKYEAYREERQENGKRAETK